MVRHGTGAGTRKNNQEARAEMQDPMEWLCRYNKTLQDNILHLQQQRQHEVYQSKGIEILDFQPLSDEIWDASVPHNLKPPSLVTFDRKNDLL